MPREPVHTVTLREDRSDDGDSSTLTAYVDTEWNLVLEGYDVGKSPKEYWGDSDYEYIRFVPAREVPKVVLELIKDRFRSETDFSNWLTEKGIESEFGSWV